MAYVAIVIMPLKTEREPMEEYLASSEYIDWRHPGVYQQALELSAGLTRSEDVIQRCFEFVLDEVKHSSDFELNPVTCRASDVLKYHTGYCYAKSHLLAALLRANGIPAGLCYQRLEAGENTFCLHGLNAVWLDELGWYRLDPRGNKGEISADFCPPIESLAFKPAIKGECDLPEIWAEPLPKVVEVLNASATFQDVLENLPDIELIKT